MNGHYAYTPYILPSFVTVILLIVLSIYSGRRRSVPGALPFMIGCLFAALWAVGSVMEYAAEDVGTKFFWAKLQGACPLPLATAIFCFVLEYAWHGRWLTRRNLILLSIPLFLVLGLILTNDIHHLAWQGFEFDGSVQPQLGPAGWIVFSYAYAVVLANIVVLAWLFVRSPYHRWPVIVMLIGLFGGRISFLLEKFEILHAILPIEVAGMGLEFLMYAIALFGFRIFDPIPMARQTVITQMQDGMLALDAQGRVVSLNPSAERILGATAKQIMGRQARELLPAYPDGHLTELSGTEIEFSRKTGQELRHYTLAISPLKDWRELEIGRLLLLHDVTAQKRAQAQLVEQQRALAMLQEREQLARELHDSLGQVFAFVNSQGQTVRRLLARGDVATADEHATRLVEVAREADVDIRESILGLRVSLSGQELLPALGQYLERYEKNYGIHTILDWPETLGRGAFEPQVEVQLLRILQEALTNARKHADAHNVRVAFTVQNERAQVAIQDDGKGFDPQELPDGFENRVGLRVMRERAVEVGGSLIVQSKPGEGALIIVTVPLRAPKESGLNSGSES